MELDIVKVVLELLLRTAVDEAVEATPELVLEVEDLLSVDVLERVLELANGVLLTLLVVLSDVAEYVGEVMIELPLEVVELSVAIDELEGPTLGLLVTDELAETELEKLEETFNNDDDERVVVLVGSTPDVVLLVEETTSVLVVVAYEEVKVTTGVTLDTEALAPQLIS